MKKLELALLLVAACPWQLALGGEKPKLAFDTYSGYFVSNKFEPNAVQSFAVIVDQKQFEKVFGVAAVMDDKSHRLPKDAFQSQVVVAVIKRGKALWEYEVQEVAESGGIVEVRYTAKSKKSESASFASPLILSIPKGNYKAVQFVENGKAVRKVDIPQPGQTPRRRPIEAGGRR